MPVDPVQIDTQAYEQTNILELIQTDNRLFNKVLKVFAWLCDETAYLEKLVSCFASNQDVIVYTIYVSAYFLHKITIFN
jgi:hypothetical protein